MLERDRAPDQFEPAQRRLIVEATVASIGILLLATAVLANQRWLDRHFLPSFFITRPTYVLLETLVRVAMGALGLVLALFLRAPIGRFAARSPSRALHVALAALLAVGASELVLGHVHLLPAEWVGPEQEPRRRPDPRLGWTFVPSRSAHSTIGGRTVDYTFDASGYRVSRVEQPVDPLRPTLLFTGESVMFGKGLTWEESIPAQVAARLGAQSANLAVDGYATDQAYLRLQTELPRFHRPIAVVTLFMTTLFGRNLDDDRPHLGPGLVWLPVVPHTRLRSLVQLVAPYRSDETVERGIAVTREVLRATVELANDRGATALVVVPQFGAEDRVEERLRHRILDEAGVPYVRVEIDPAWRIPGDVHPDPHAAQLIAAAVAAGLRSRLQASGFRPRVQARASLSHEPGVWSPKPGALENSLCSERIDGVDLRSAPRGDPGRQRCQRDFQTGGGTQCDRIVWTDADQHV
jgi:hypothetical protein